MLDIVIPLTTHFQTKMSLYCCARLFLPTKYLCQMGIGHAAKYMQKALEVVQLPNMDLACDLDIYAL